ncbi:MAG: class I SAM-dependent methyltransferase [Phycisphaerae bacterium]
MSLLCAPTSTAVCRTCGRTQPADATLCVHCRNPLSPPRKPPAAGDSAASAAALEHATDHTLCLDALLATLAEARREPGACPPFDAGAWDAYLSLFWARPETALVLIAQHAAFADWLGDAAGLTLLDAGCGDGLHTAVMTGWRFDDAFDAFSTVTTNIADLFDAPAVARPRITRRGGTRLLGIDLKANTLARARSLGCFAGLTRGDLTALPLPDASVDVLFSNMLGQLDDASLRFALAEARRVLRPEGRLVASSLTPAFAQAAYFWNEADEAARRNNAPLADRLRTLDRGRHAFERLRDEPTWRAFLQEAGMKLLDRRGTIDVEVMRLWDVGLRPFAPALLARAAALRDADAWPVAKPMTLELLHAALDPLLGKTLNPQRPCMQMLLACPA